MTPFVACITGADGSGKSTQVNALARRLRKAGKVVAVSTIWDPMLDPSFAGRALFDRPADADEYLTLLVSPSRMHFLCHALHESLALAIARQPDVVLLNAYWYKYYAAELAHGGERVVLEKITSAFPAPDITFFLRISAAEAARRKQKFTGYETGFASPARAESSFKTFQETLGGELEALAASLSWTGLDGHRPPSVLSDQLFEAVAVLIPITSP